ncbi:MAG: imidazole glycerol phosphate synthase subunit HisH [Lysobacter sp.]
MTEVVLIDAGGANLGSVRYALERLGARVRVSAVAAEIAAAERVILPGVGAAATGMARLRELGLVDLVRSLQQPLLGVCLGMQLLYDSSEEGDVECLGLLPGRVRKLVPAEADAVRVPHMGWNRLRHRSADRLLAGIDDGAQVYFVHSYAAPVTADAIASCHHGADFAAVVRRGNRYGAQFHPERSATVGSCLLENFLSESLG